jgi:hypothetical protein
MGRDQHIGNERESAPVFHSCTRLVLGGNPHDVDKYK